MAVRPNLFQVVVLLHHRDRHANPASNCRECIRLAEDMVVAAANEMGVVRLTDDGLQQWMAREHPPAIDDSKDAYANFILAAEEAVQDSNWQRSSPMQMLITGCKAAVKADRLRMAMILRQRSGEALPPAETVSPEAMDMIRAAHAAYEVAAGLVERGCED